MAHFDDMEDVQLEAAPLEASLEDLDNTCPTDREIAEVEAGAGTVLEKRPLTWTWSGVKDALVRAWDVADTHLAHLFGLNESKYEWAVREYYYQKSMEAEEITQAVQQQSSQEMQDRSHAGFEAMPQARSAEGNMV